MSEQHIGERIGGDAASRRMRRGVGSTLWRQIADRLRDEIEARGARAGERIEPEDALARQFSVNRHTVRQAIRALVEEGVLRVEHGRGTFIEARGIDYPLSARTRYSEAMLAQGIEPRREILSVSSVKAGAEEAAALGLRRGARLECVEARTHVGAASFAYATHLFPASRLAGIGSLVAELGSISAALARLGHSDYRRAWTRITAELPDETMAERLGRPRNRPVLVTESLNVSAAGVPLEFGRAVFAGDLCRLTVAGDP